MVPMKENKQKTLIGYMLSEELLTLIHKETEKAFFKKDGTPFKREKRYWIKNLITRVAENLNLRKDIVEMSIKKLIEDCYLIKDFRDEVYYRPEEQSETRALNKRLRVLGRKVRTRGGYVESLKDRETLKKIGITKRLDPIEVWLLFCDKIFEYHNEKISNLNKENQTIEALKSAVSTRQKIDVKSNPAVEELIVKSFKTDPESFKKPFKAYTGDEPFVFASYAHSDKLEVYPIIDYFS